MKYYLAVDGGGTKTDTVCADESGLVVGRGISGPTSLTSTSVGAASFNLIESIRQAVENLPDNNQIEFSILVMGLAGIDSEKEQREAYNIFKQAIAYYKIHRFVLLHDSLIALENGTKNKDAVILISGTGSVCYGRNSAGETAKVSGMDYLLADQGCGYDIGRRVLREAVKSFDGRGPKSVLEELVCKHYKIANILDLKNVVYYPPLTKIEVAELAPLCSAAFADGDTVAKAIFDETIADIVIMVQTVVERLTLNRKQFDLVFSGSIMAIPYVNKGVSEVFQKQCPLIHIVTPQGEPVFGALRVAMR